MVNKEIGTFGKTIKKLRSEKNLSIKRLSMELKVDYSYISKLENSHSKPSEEFIRKISAFFNYDPEELMLQAGKIPPDLLKILINNPKKAADFLREQFPNDG